MKNLILSILIILIGCSDHSETQPSEIEIKPEKMEQEEMAKVTGIGGIFFKCEDPEKMKRWFHKNLGLVVNEYGSIYEFRTKENPNNFGYLQWSPFSDKTTYFEPSEKELMINYRVNDLERLLTELKKNGVKILDTIKSYEYGKFLHILDPENNKIELWEPIDASFEALYHEGQSTIESGIGGVFFKAKDPQAIKDWYNKNLGIVSDDHGCLFEFYNPVNKTHKNYMQWSPFSDETTYFAPSTKEFMINYRVKNIEQLVEALKESGVTVVDSIETFGEYGKFVHVMGPENQKIELWEQPESL